MLNRRKVSSVSEKNQIIPSMDVVTKCNNLKINKFIEDINRKVLQKDVVLLLMDIAEKPEISIDYNISISHYLTLYIRCKEEPILSEAGCLILNAAKIYARRVDNIHDCIARILTGFEEVSNNIEDINVQNKNSEIKKRINKRTLPPHDYLQEYDLSPKKFKISVEEKICDNEAMESFEPPIKYFLGMKKYIEWRKNNKKRMKPSKNMSNDYIDAALWKCSTIEDFDYEDDIDTKRNYRLFNNFIEPRYSTLFSDINFKMHFKVKDYIEAEEEQIENEASLGLPMMTPKRNWPPLCKFLANLSESGSDYITKYIDLENTVLEKEIRDNDESIVFDFLQKRNKTSNMNRSDLELSNNDTFESEKTNDESNVNLNNSDNSRTSLHRDLSDNDVTNTNDSNLTFAKPTNIDEVDSEPEIFDPEKILVRLSTDDEGVFFSELDDVDRAMLNPRVVATNIISSLETDIENISKIKMNVDKEFAKFFGIDESFIKIQENFKLTRDIINHKENLVLNIFKLPKKLCKKRRCFSLPEEYNLYMKDRKKCHRLKEVNPPSLQNSIINNTQTQNGLITDSFDVSNDISQSNDKFRSLSLDSGFGGKELCESLENSQNTIGIGDTLEDNILADENQSLDNDVTYSSELIESDQLKERNVNEMILKIQNWHRYLKPILAQSKTRHHFDVFKLGTEIIDKFPKVTNTTNSGEITFKNVMEEKDDSFTSRYFLSMLILANASNVAITVDNENKNQPANTENIKLQLISRKRHTVSVEDNIGMHSNKRICSSKESVIFPKPIVAITKIQSDDNDSGFYSQNSFDSSLR